MSPDQSHPRNSHNLPAKVALRLCFFFCFLVASKWEDTVKPAYPNGSLKPKQWASFILPGTTVAAQSDSVIDPQSDEWVWLLSDRMNPDDFDSEADFEAYLEEMAGLFPVDLNRSNRELLMMIPDIPERTVTAIIEYRKTRDFGSVDELLEVTGIGPAIFNTLRPWVTVYNNRSKTRIPPTGPNSLHFFRFQQSFPTPAGYHSNGTTPPHYPGHPSRLYHRQTVSGSRFSVNLTQVKLPGEPMTQPAGFDFTSVYATIEEIGPVTRLIVGDYSLRFGQGITLWSTPSFGKGDAAHSAPFRRQHGITPYRSSGQTPFLRGVASEIALPSPILLPGQETRILLSGFYSNRARSSVEIDSVFVRPPTSNPYHRTETERNRRNNVREKIQGGNLRVENPHLSIGTTYYTYTLGRPVVPYPQSSPFRGSENRVWGTDVQLMMEPIRLFGEFATRLPGPKIPTHTPKSRNAWTAGIMGSLSEPIDWVISFRNYGPGYWSEMANGFSEGSGPPSNQKGWYFGLRIRPFSGLRVDGFLDRFYFPEPTGSAARPGQGWESLLQINYRLQNNINLLGRIRRKERTTEVNVRDSYSRLAIIAGNEYRISGRLRLRWQLRDKLVLLSQYDRIQTGSHVQGNGSHDYSQSPETRFTSEKELTRNTNSMGIAFSQTVRLQIGQSVRLDTSWSFFDTEDYSSRIYLYEYDLTNTMSSRMVYGLGRLSYIVMRFHPARWILIEAKYARIRYYDRPAIGTGHNRTYGPGRSHLGLQMRFLF